MKTANSARWNARAQALRFAQLLERPFVGLVRLLVRLLLNGALDEGA